MCRNALSVFVGVMNSLLRVAALVMHQAIAPVINTCESSKVVMSQHTLAHVVPVNMCLTLYQVVLCAQHMKFGKAVGMTIRAVDRW